MKNFTETMRRAWAKWAFRIIAGEVGSSELTIAQWNKGEDLPKNILTVARIALFLGLKLRPFLEEWIEAMKQRYGHDKIRIKITDMLLLLLPAIAATNAKSLRDFSQDYGYDYRSLRYWLYGDWIPSPTIRERLSQDLGIDLDKIDKAVQEKGQFRFLGGRKKPKYPSAVARLVHQARKEGKLSLKKLEKLGFLNPAIWQLENTTKPVYGILSGRLFELADTLGISRLDILVARLMDDMNRGSSRVNLAKIPFSSAKCIFLLSAVRGISLSRLAKKAGLTEQIKIYKFMNFMNGKRLVTEQELDILLSCLDADEDDLELIRAAWRREHKIILKRQRRERIKRYEELIKSFPEEILDSREKDFLRLYIGQGWNFAEIGRKKSLSREWVRQIIKRAFEKIENWREIQRQ